MSKIRVLIVSQQSLFRQGIEHSLSDIEDIKVLGTAEVNDEVLSAIDTLPPDVALVDVDAPSDSGLTLARKIKRVRKLRLRSWLRPSGGYLVVSTP